MRFAVHEALRCKEEGVSLAILLQPVRARHIDSHAAADYLEGKQVDAVLARVVLEKSPARLPVFA